MSLATDFCSHRPGCLLEWCVLQPGHDFAESLQCLFQGLLV